MQTPCNRSLEPIHQISRKVRVPLLLTTEVGVVVPAWGAEARARIRQDEWALRQLGHRLTLGIAKKMTPTIFKKSVSTLCVRTAGTSHGAQCSPPRMRNSTQDAEVPMGFSSPWIFRLSHFFLSISDCASNNLPFFFSAAYF